LAFLAPLFYIHCAFCAFGTVIPGVLNQPTGSLLPRFCFGCVCVGAVRYLVFKKQGWLLPFLLNAKANQLLFALPFKYYQVMSRNLGARGCDLFWQYD